MMQSHEIARKATTNNENKMVEKRRENRVKRQSQQNKKSLFQLGSKASIEHTVDLSAASLRRIPLWQVERKAEPSGHPALGISTKYRTISWQSLVARSIVKRISLLNPLLERRTSNRQTLNSWTHCTFVRWNFWTKNRDQKLVRNVCHEHRVDRSEKEIVSQELVFEKHIFVNKIRTKFIGDITSSHRKIGGLSETVNWWKPPDADIPGEEKKGAVFYV